MIQYLVLSLFHILEYLQIYLMYSALFLEKQGFYLLSLFIQYAAALVVIRKDIAASERCEQLRGKRFREDPLE